jgi:hypothetical protein
VSIGPDQPPALLEVAGAPLEPTAWTIAAFAAPPGYHGALAIRERNVAVILRTAAAADLLHGS